MSVNRWSERGQRLTCLEGLDRLLERGHLGELSLGLLQTALEVLDLALVGVRLFLALLQFCGKTSAERTHTHLRDQQQTSLEGSDLLPQPRHLGRLRPERILLLLELEELVLERGDVAPALLALRLARGDRLVQLRELRRARLGRLRALVRLLRLEPLGVEERLRLLRLCACVECPSRVSTVRATYWTRRC
jgi:hypothetical protein